MPVLDLGSLGIALGAGVASLRLAAGRESRWWRFLLPALALLALFLPLGDPAAPTSLASYLRGSVGELSITSLVLLSVSLVARAGGPDLRSLREIELVFVLAAAGAVVLYPMSLGLTLFDPYALGFGSTAFVFALGSLALASWVARRTLALACLVTAAAGWSLELLESRNLWDYLLDPWLAIFAVGWLAVRTRS